MERDERQQEKRPGQEPAGRGTAGEQRGAEHAQGRAGRGRGPGRSQEHQPDGSREQAGRAHQRDNRAGAAGGFEDPHSDTGQLFVEERLGRGVPRPAVEPRRRHHRCEPLARRRLERPAGRLDEPAGGQRVRPPSGARTRPRTTTRSRPTAGTRARAARRRTFPRSPCRTSWRGHSRPRSPARADTHASGEASAAGVGRGRILPPPGVRRAGRPGEGVARQLDRPGPLAAHPASSTSPPSSTRSRRQPSSRARC